MRQSVKTEVKILIFNTALLYIHRHTHTQNKGGHGIFLEVASCHNIVFIAIVLVVCICCGCLYLLYLLVVFVVWVCCWKCLYCLLSCVYIVCCLLVVSVLFVCCLIVVPLPPGENPFAVNNNNNNNRKQTAKYLRRGCRTNLFRRQRLGGAGSNLGEHINYP
jgi:hypothetical protein